MSITAMRQALEALGKCRYRSLADEIVDPAITALRTAIEQTVYIQDTTAAPEAQPAPVQPEQEPVASMAWQEGFEAGRLAEREACAALAEQTVCDTHLPTGVKIYGTRAAKVIRARGQA